MTKSSAPMSTSGRLRGSATLASAVRLAPICGTAVASAAEQTESTEKYKPQRHKDTEKKDCLLCVFVSLWLNISAYSVLSVADGTRAAGITTDRIIDSRKSG